MAESTEFTAAQLYPIWLRWWITASSDQLLIAERASPIGRWRWRVRRLHAARLAGCAGKKQLHCLQELVFVARAVAVAVHADELFWLVRCCEETLPLAERHDAVGRTVRNEHGAASVRDFRFVVHLVVNEVSGRVARDAELGHIREGREGAVQ